ncbi:MAG TPA: ROK family protein [Intrasporangium sp.]|uniref:ROK family protein n=1 Tax=Intrasporangium sp. TaxID=1925024 RepID=UPI002F9480B4
MRLGIDIGGTKTAAVALDTAGRVVAYRQAPSGRGVHEVIRVAVQVARATITAAGPASPIEAVGACTPGLVDQVTGVVRHAVNLDVESLSLAAGLSAQLGVSVGVENDVKAAALGAVQLLARRRDRVAPRSLGYLNLGTGLAAAMVVDGQVVRGLEGSAGEIGHLPVGGVTVCSCGQVGCLETLASGAALARRWSGAPVELFAAARAGDPVARAAADDLGRGVGTAVQILVVAAGAQHVAVGGGLTGLGEPLVTAVRQHLHDRSRASPLMAALRLQDRFEVVPQDVPIAALGAASLGGETAPALAG